MRHPGTRESPRSPSAIPYAPTTPRVCSASRARSASTSSSSVPRSHSCSGWRTPCGGSASSSSARALPPRGSKGRSRSRRRSWPRRASRPPRGCRSLDRRVSSRRTGSRPERASSSAGAGRGRRGAALAAAASGGDVVVEELLEGPEVSLVRGLRRARARSRSVSAQDFKRAFDGDRGRTPAGWARTRRCPGRRRRAESLVEQVHRPVLEELARRGAPFVGLLYAGLMLTADGPEGPRVQLPVRRSRDAGPPAAARERPPASSSATSSLSARSAHPGAATSRTATRCATSGVPWTAPLCPSRSGPARTP